MYNDVNSNHSEVASSESSVKLLSLHRETRLHFAQAGIVSLHQVIEMDEETLLSYRFIGKKTVKKIKAQAEAYLSNCPIKLNDVPKECRSSGWFFDIETNPSTDQVWSIGWSQHDNPTQILIVVPQADDEVLQLPDGRVITLVSSVHEAWTTFAKHVSIDDQPIFHWTSFDASNMRKHAPSDVVAALNSRLHDLFSSFKNTVQLPERSNSLKMVAPYAGFHWRGYQDWWAALRDYRMFLSTSDATHLVEACHYQAGDIEAMVAVWKWLNSFTAIEG